MFCKLPSCYAIDCNVICRHRFHIQLVAKLAASMSISVNNVVVNILERQRSKFTCLLFFFLSIESYCHFLGVNGGNWVVGEARGPYNLPRPRCITSFRGSSRSVPEKKVESYHGEVRNFTYSLHALYRCVYSLKAEYDEL